MSGEPDAVTFSDGSEHAYCSVLYLHWDCNNGPKIRLVESEAKLTPLDHKGDAVKTKLCGAVFATRLKKYFEQHGQIQVKWWYHLFDSQIVLGAIQLESYSFQTFFANRMGEIQSSTQLQDWWWIPGPLNIADVITCGVGPEDLNEDITPNALLLGHTSTSGDWKTSQATPTRGFRRCSTRLTSLGGHGASWPFLTSS